MTDSLHGKYKFPRELRLLTPSQFSFVFDNAIPLGSKYFTLLARYNTSNEHSRLGITIAKKRVRKAVERNRVKRIIRESYRYHAQTLENIDIIVIAKSGCDSLNNKQLHKHFQVSWQKLKKKCNRTSLSNS